MEQKFYHQTPRSNVYSIRVNGLKPGTDTNQGERLNCVMLTNKPYDPQIGQFAYFEVTLDSDDPKLHCVNEEWVEYHGEIPPQNITALALPPQDVEDLIKVIQDFGVKSTQYRELFSYKSIALEYKSYDIT